eukprot:1130297-Rhodomonas_salina.8
MSDNELLATVLRACYGLSGTELAYAGSSFRTVGRAVKNGGRSRYAYGSTGYCVGQSRTLLRAVPDSA